MTATHSAGPEIVFGSLMNQLGSGGSGSAGSNPDAGPSGTYQGDCVLDPRVTYQPGVTGKGKVFAFLDSPYVMMADATPSAAGAAKVAAAQAATATVPMALANAVAAGINPGTPIIPSGLGYKAANVVPVLALDLGFATCGTVAGSATISGITRMALLAPGVTVLVAGGVNGAIIAATVLSIAGTTATTDTAMGATLAGAALALANGSGQNSAGPAPYPPVAFWPWLTAGALAVFDATQGIARGLSVTSNNAGDVGWSVNVAGYDIYGVPMHETIAVAANGTAYGWKAWKFITSVTPAKGGGGATAGTLSIGTSDLFGLNIRGDYWEAENMFWNGAYSTLSTGFTPADTTSPATAVTKDVRGTYQISAIGPNGAGASATTSNGALRLTMYQTLHPYALLGSTPQNTVPLFGVTQF